MISEYHGCEKHNKPWTGTNCSPECPDCWDAVAEQQATEERNNHSDSEEIEYIVNNDEIGV